MGQYSRYPNAIDSSTEIPKATDNVTPVNAEGYNRVRDAILEVESELGINPSGTFGTVAARLDAFESGGGGGGGSGSISVEQDSVSIEPQATTFNFTGDVSISTGAPHEVLIDIGAQTQLKQEPGSVLSPGQTSFTLTSTPMQANTVLMFVNGMKQLYGVDYAVAGTTVSYVGPSLLTSDKIEFWYVISLITAPSSSSSGSVSVTTVKTSDYLASLGDFIKADPTGGAFTITLPTAVGNSGRSVTVKNVSDSVNDINIDTTGLETIDDSSSIIMDVARLSYTFVSDGFNWMVS